MRPIQLTIAGLQSYRELQVIDFEQLSASGVFGIFGPTGSGKSSILDAMTLALYGKVERAANGTQGIMNQGENTLSVSFTFRLSSGGSVNEYKVERQFKRTSDVGVTSTVSRLLSIDSAGHTVLADKATDVTNQVQEILGLQMQDFTRAVVLPQGKFAEFLSLTGKDRRQMLQRLFHLEQYGDVLMARLSGKYKDTDTEIKRIEAEQLGLGDASKEALDQADQWLKETSAHCEWQRERLVQCEQAYEQHKQIWELQLEREALEVQQTALKQEQPHIIEQETRLRSAESAATVMPVLHEWQQAGQEVVRLEALEQQAELAQAQVNAQYIASKQIYEHCSNELASQQPILMVKLDQFKQALQVEQDIQQGNKQVAEYQSSLASLDARLHELSGSLAKEQDTFERAIAKQAQLKDQLASVEVKAEERHNIQEAAQDKQRIDSLVLQKEELTQEWNSLQTELQQLSKSSTIFDAESRQYTRQLEQSVRGLFDLGQQLSAKETMFVDWHKQISDMIQQVKTEESAQLRKRMAVELAHQLTEGEPCPVCGSAHHPTPVNGTLFLDAGEEHVSDLRVLEEMGMTGRDMQYAFRQLSSKAQDLVAQLEDFNHFTALREAAATTIFEAEQSPAINMANASSLVIHMRQLLDQQQLDLQHAESIWETTERQIRLAIQQIRKVEQQIADVHAQISTMDKVRHTSEEKISALEKLLAKQKLAWHTSYPQIQLEHIQAELARLSAQDQQAEQLRESLRISEPFIEQKRTQIELVKEQIGLAEKERVLFHTQVAGLHHVLLAKQAQLTQLVGQSQVGALIAETEATLLKLRQDEAQAKQQWEQDTAHLQTANHDHSSARQACQSAREMLTKAEKKFQEALHKTSFTSMEQIRDNHLSEGTITELREEVERYREQEQQLVIKLNQVLDKLAGRAVTVEQWQETQLKLSEMKQAYEASIQDKAKAERNVEQLLLKHEHWNGLETRKGELQQLFERFAKLQSVFRGNAFVEYVAEEQLMQVSRAASERLGYLTRQRYALEVDSSGGFVIRDDANGGVRRPVSTLSGGETFLTSLALALALSAQIQLRGQYPLEFFFLDEGFGTLDPDLLDTVVTALEKLHMDRLAVGVISHVPELRARLPRKLIVHPAEPGGSGSRVELETF